MWALDTNVLVRVLARGDDEQQNNLAQEFMRRCIERHEQVFVPLVVLVETLWLFRTRLKATPQRAYQIARSIVDHPHFVVENAAVVEAALEKTEAAPAQLTDAIIAYSSRINRASGTVTFDRKAVRDAGMVLLTAELARGG